MHLKDDRKFLQDLGQRRADNKTIRTCTLKKMRKFSRRSGNCTLVSRSQGSTIRKVMGGVGNFRLARICFYLRTWCMNFFFARQDEYFFEFFVLHDLFFRFFPHTLPITFLIVDPFNTHVVCTGSWHGIFFTCDFTFLPKFDPRSQIFVRFWFLIPKISFGCDPDPKPKILIHNPKNMLIPDPIFHIKPWSLIPYCHDRAVQLWAEL